MPPLRTPWFLQNISLPNVVHRTYDFYLNIDLDNMYKIIPFVLLTGLLSLCTSCTSQGQTQPVKASFPSKEFSNYWYQGKAEITSYALTQSRYGELHEGHAVLVFVTEDFSRKKQVKLDNPSMAGKDKVPVLKLNFSKKFLTGIYPYSILTSVFSPVDFTQHPHSLKVTTSVQEWCGQTYTQLNLGNNNYRLQGYSYFESEGDQEQKLPITWTEEELWTRLRLDPESIPTGQVSIIPGQMISRLVHTSFQPQNAIISKGKSEGNAWDANTQFLKIVFGASQRTLTLYYQNTFPYQILGWEETYRGLTTTARKKESLMTAYWSRHGNRDRELREKLGL